MKRIAAITSVRNGERFLNRWISYYGEQIGHQNLFVILDGLDQSIPDMSSGVNVKIFDYKPMSRVAGDKYRAIRASNLAHKIMEIYDIVIGVDVDEFLILDPKKLEGLATYLSNTSINGNLSAMGIDVAPYREQDYPLDWSKKFLDQRSYGLISDRYTKSCILSATHFWGSGFHRVKGQPFHIDPYLYLFHFGSVDTVKMEARSMDQELVKSGWTNHQTRRNMITKIISTNTACDGDAVFEKVRALLSRSRSVISWNKPKPLKSHQVIKIPKRFQGIV